MSSDQILFTSVCQEGTLILAIIKAELEQLQACSRQSVTLAKGEQVLLTMNCFDGRSQNKIYQSLQTAESCFYELLTDLSACVEYTSVHLLIHHHETLSETGPPLTPKA